jgi:hypothetical protein
VLAQQLLPTSTMRTFIAVILMAGLGGLFLWQRNGNHNQVANHPSAVERTAASPAAAIPPNREPSEHNWMKRSLDRARDVTEKSRNRTRDAQSP